MNNADATQYAQQLIADGYFDHPVTDFGLCESHAGFVILTGPYAYKFRKPMSLPFHLDYTTPGKREHCLRKELALNTIFGHDVYRQVLPVYREARGHLRRTGTDAPIDYLLQMRELPQTDLLSNYLARGAILSKEALRRLADTMATFHARIPVVPADSHAGLLSEYPWVLANLPPHIDTATRAAHQAQVTHVTAQRTMFAHRNTGGFVRDTHGDFRADNIFYHAGVFYPFDRLEFHDPYRWRDVASDVAALLVDFCFHGHAEWIVPFLDTYGAHPIGTGIHEILPFYMHFRTLLMVSVHHDLATTQTGEIAQANLAKSQRYCDVSHTLMQTTESSQNP